MFFQTGSNNQPKIARAIGWRASGGNMVVSFEDSANNLVTDEELIIPGMTQLQFELVAKYHVPNEIPSLLNLKKDNIEIVKALGRELEKKWIRNETYFGDERTFRQPKVVFGTNQVNRTVEPIIIMPHEAVAGDLLICYKMRDPSSGDQITDTKRIPDCSFANVVMSLEEMPRNFNAFDAKIEQLPNIEVFCEKVRAHFMAHSPAVRLVRNNLDVHSGVVSHPASPSHSGRRRPPEPLR